MATNNGTATAKKLITTNGDTYYGIGLKNSAKALSTKYMEASVCIAIHSELPENMQSSNSRYDYKSGLSIYLKPYTAKMFSKLVKSARAALASGNPVTAASVASGANVIEVSDGTKFGLNPGITICIYSDIQPDKKTDTYDVFQFGTAKYLINYDRNTGSYENGEYDTDTEMFIDELTDFVHSSNNAQTHSSIRGFAYDVNRIHSSMLAIKDKLGIASSDYKFSSNNNSGGWNKGYKPAETSESMSTDDLMDELDNM